MTTARVRRSWVARIGRALLWAIGGASALVLALVALSQTKLLPAFFRLPHPTLVRATGRDARWQQDLRYLSTQLPRLHANAFFHVQEDEWRAAVARLDARVSELADDQIAVEMRRLVAMIGDGHTQLYVGAGNQTRVYPLGLRWFPDGLAVVAAAPDYRHAVGMRVLQIDGTDVQAAYEAVAPLISHDNETTLLTASPQLLVSPDVLSVLGITRAGDRATYLVEDPDGVRSAIEVRAYDGAQEELQLLGVLDVNPALAENPPLYLSNRQDYYWFQYLPDSGTLFFQYNRCSEMASRPFELFAQDLFAVVDRHAEDLQRVVVDLRYNGGGNSVVIRPFLAGLERRPTLSKPGRLFAIIGRGTFSSAMMNALEIHSQGGLLVGEPTGGRPNAYGETRRFRLPNSAFRVQYSTRYWRLLKDSDPASVMPDLPVEPTLTDYLAGRDTALEVILGYDPYP